MTLLKTELKLFAREPAPLFFGVLLPVIILVIIGLIPDSGKNEADLGGISAIDTYVPTMSIFALAILSISVLPQVLATYREKGILRRLSTTPAKPASLLGAQLAIHTGAALVAVVAVVAVGNLAFGVPLPDPFLGFLVTLAFAAASLLALGMVIAALAKRSRLAGAVGSLLFFPLMFFGGLWFPQAAMDGALLTISEATPVGAAVGALQDVTTGGSFPDASHLGVLAAWTVAAAAVALHRFRWE